MGVILYVDSGLTNLISITRSMNISIYSSCLALAQLQRRSGKSIGITLTEFGQLKKIFERSVRVITSYVMILLTLGNSMISSKLMTLGSSSFSLEEFQLMQFTRRMIT